ncbi:MAG: hypothetical protein PF692_06435 [Kiritimatiellae bacterium]|nr:hypothetical protein [Kiritimatiellia bacterium]
MKIYLTGGVTSLRPAINNIINLVSSWATPDTADIEGKPYKTPANQPFSFGYRISNCRVGVLHPAEKAITRKIEDSIVKLRKNKNLIRI